MMLWKADQSLDVLDYHCVQTSQACSGPGAGKRSNAEALKRGNTKIFKVCIFEIENSITNRRGLRLPPTIKTKREKENAISYFG